MGKSWSPTPAPARRRSTRRRSPSSRPSSRRAAAPKPTPKALNAAVGKVRGIRDVTESLAAITKRGGRAIYLACDASDGAKVEAACKAKTKHGLTMTGIVHAAGVLRDKMVENKTVDDFDSVFGVKITGLTNILTALSASERQALRHLVVFSSLASFHGNAGQTDYAMANDALSKMTHSFGSLYPNCSPRALCFGPWDGGMVTPALKAHFKSQGVEIIPRPEGAEQVAAVLTMQGKRAQPVPLRQLGPPGVDAGRRELSVSKIRPRRRRPCSSPHLIQGKAVVPMTVATAMMASAVVKAHPGFFLDSVKDAKLFGGLDADGRRRDRHQDEARRRRRRRGQAHVQGAGPDQVGGQAQAGVRLHAILAPMKAAAPTPATARRAARRRRRRQMYDGETLFHGPLLQGLVQAEGIGADDVDGRQVRPGAAHVRAGGPARHASEIDGFAADVMMQAVLVVGARADRPRVAAVGHRRDALARELPAGGEYFLAVKVDVEDRRRSTAVTRTTPPASRTSPPPMPQHRDQRRRLRRGGRRGRRRRPLTKDGHRVRAKGSALTREIDYQRAQAIKYKATGKPLLWDFDDLLITEGDVTSPVFNKHKRASTRRGR